MFAGLGCDVGFSDKGKTKRVKWCLLVGKRIRGAAACFVVDVLMPEVLLRT